jgi:release factor glutamine methyltransferase
MSEHCLNTAQALSQAKQILTNSGSDSPQLDSEILLLKVLNDAPNSIQKTPYNKTWLMTWPEKCLTQTQAEQFFHYVNLRTTGKPIAYITGYKDFWTLCLHVTSATLIPRPETEQLVECALEKIMPDARQDILDLGTGSGAIALAIASERPLAQILATDMSTSALAVAQQNAIASQLTNVCFKQADWFSGINSQAFDMIVSNPPYISEDDPYLEEHVRQYEPLSALHAKHNGLADIQAIITTSRAYLKDNGWLLFEHGHKQSEAVQSLFSHYGFSQISTINDLNHMPRVTMAQLSINN